MKKSLLDRLKALEKLLAPKPPKLLYVCEREIGESDESAIRRHKAAGARFRSHILIVPAPMTEQAWIDMYGIE